MVPRGDISTPATSPGSCTFAVWEDDRGEVAGFSVFYPKGNDLAFQFAPGRSADLALVDGMLTWGAEQRARWGNPDQPLLAMVWLGDHAFRAHLEEMGWSVTNDPPMLMTEQLLGRDLPTPELPVGFTIRPIAAPADLPDRVRIHQEVWAPSRVTDASYARLREAKGYDPDLDLGVFGPDGELAAYCVLWELDGIGQFEPVGARERYRRRGLTRALLLDGLRRLRERGSRTAVVTCHDPEGGACALYFGAGFRETGRWDTWREPGFPRG